MFEDLPVGQPDGRTQETIKPKGRTAEVKNIFELSEEQEKRFIKISSLIRPTNDEVDDMSEYDWITTIYPRRIYDETLKQCQTIADAELKQKLYNLNWIQILSNAIKSAAK